MSSDSLPQLQLDPDRGVVDAWLCRKYQQKQGTRATSNFPLADRS